MSLQNKFGLVAVSMLLAGGCDLGGTADLDNDSKAFKACNMDNGCASSNCDDINQPYQGPGSDFSLAYPSTTAYRYKLTGFYLDSAGTWRVRGFVINVATQGYTPLDGTVNRPIVNNLQQPLVSLSASAAQLSLTYCTLQATPCTSGNQKTISGDQLKGVQLGITIPGPAGRGFLDYTLSFDSGSQILDLVKPSSVDVGGYSISYLTKGGQVAPLCAGPGGVTQRTLFYQSAYWNPQTFIKTADKNSVTVSCELGAIAACMSWGYKPWELTSYQKQQQSMDDWHATCVNAKTANYCGDGYAWTKYGTSITVSDPLNPPVMSDPLTYVEALWTPKGAACVNAANRRIPSLLWGTASCHATMPDCSTYEPSSYFGTGIPVPNP